MPSALKPRRIKDALVTLLTGLQYGGEDAFQLVTSDPSKEPDQEPWALVFPNEMLSVKGATGQQDRTVSFDILMSLNLEDNARTQSETYDYMYDLTDLVLSGLESSDFHDSLNAIDSSLGTWILDVPRAQFSPAESKNGLILLCIVNVGLTYSIDL